MSDDNNKSFYEDLAEQLYNLDRSELRRLAYEALLISDGLDHIEGDVSNTTIEVDRTAAWQNGVGWTFRFEVQEMHQDRNIPGSAFDQGGL
jgi:hypothetical protein